MPHLGAKACVSFRQVVAICLLVAAVSGGLGMVSQASKEQYSAGRYWQRLALVPVRAPARLPVPSQEDVDIAMALFSIHAPADLDWPVFDPELADRGLTTGSTLSGPKAVYVGPAAFVSWAVLGSTLAHEVEVHGRQDFLEIVLQDQFFRLVGHVLSSGEALAKGARRVRFGADSGAEVRASVSHLDQYGTWKAEREAYAYEIKNARRFGLSAEEVQLIRQVMETHYPHSGGTN